jgi:hypothetical protein
VHSRWDQLSVEEVLGPGRRPVGEPRDRSVAAALVATLGFGPVGLCYVSGVGAMISTGLTVLAVFLFGPATLGIAWPLSMACAGIIASGMHRDYTRQ